MRAQTITVPWFGVYLYRSDGTYSRALWAKTQEEFTKLLPKIARHVKKGLEVQSPAPAMKGCATARGGSIEWDGIGLGPLLQPESLGV